MHDSYKYLENYCYLKDKSSFYNRKSKKPIQEDTVLKAILAEKPEWRRDIVKATEALELMKEAGINYTDLGEKPLRIDPESIYEASSELLPYKWLTRLDGEEAFYHISPENEATALLGVTAEDFVSSIRSNRELFAALYDRFKDIKNENPKLKLEFKNYLKLLFEELRMDPDRALEQPPRLISWDHNELAFKQFNPELLVDQPTPTWDQFLSRVDYPNVFLAWVWSVFDPENMGRQALWLYGKGADGKSRVLVALTEIFGKRQTGSVSQDGINGQFFYSKVYGKRLTIYGDCKNTRLISQGKIHSLLGGDYVQIESKGRDAFHDRVYSRLLVSANDHPEIDFSLKNESSRIIELCIDSVDKSLAEGDRNFESNLVTEQWGFLYKCRQAYAELCPSRMEIRLPKELKDRNVVYCRRNQTSNFLVNQCVATVSFGDWVKMPIVSE